MSARYLKKVLKQQEEEHEIQNDDSESEELSPPQSNTFRNPFDLLDDADPDSDQEKDDVAGENSEHYTTDKLSSVKPDVNASSKPNSKSKKKKKKKSKEDLSKGANNGKGSLSLASENLTMGASSSSSQEVSSLPMKLKSMNIDSGDAMMKKEKKSSVLHVDPKFLNAESEMRRIFGSKVVSSYERSRAPVNPRQLRGGRKVGHTLKKTILVTPSEHWPRYDGSLSMELLETIDGINYFRYVHSSSYAQAQRAFEAAKNIHDFNSIASLLVHYPYHIDSLTTLADYFKFTGDHQRSADAIAKCLYALECAWHPQFTPSRSCQLKYVHETNKPLFSSLFTHMKNMDRRGCHRSALEICKLLLSLDSDDPMGAKLCIDYYSLRAEEYLWLEQFGEEYGSDNSLWLFPNFSYSLAISRFYLERNENIDGGANGVGKSASSDLMKQALMLHPSVVKKLVEKVPLKDRTWSIVLKHSFFKSDQTGSASLDHLISIYVERSYLIWRLPELQKFLSDSALSVIDMLEKNASEAKDWGCVRKEAFSSEKNEYSHLLVSEFSDAMPTMPPENLHDFMVDPRGVGGVENNPGFPHVLEEHHEVRDVANRNPLAVLFESILPWANYGTGDGEDVEQHDHQPEQAGED